MAALAVPVVVLAPLAAAVHLALFIVNSLGRSLCFFGRWQAGFTGRATAFSAGLAWALVAVWTTVACLNAAMGSKLIGRPVSGADEFVDYTLRFRTLGELPPDVQQRRRALVTDLEQYGTAVHSSAEILQKALEDNECLFRHLPPAVRRKLTGMPWYFVPAALSEDGVDHSELLLGPLLFAWMLLIRWPGTFALLRFEFLQALWFLLRLGGAAYAVFGLIEWMPVTDYLHFVHEPGAATLSFRLLSPVHWLGVDDSYYVRAEWYLFNAGVWLLLIGAAVFVWWSAWRISPLLGWPRYYVAFLAARLLQRKRIAFFSVGAVTLCVAMMIIVISVMGGFVDSIRQRAHGLLGDLVMDGGLQGFPYYQGFIDKIAALKDEKTGRPIVVQATPLVRNYGILQFPATKKSAPVTVLGIRLDEFVRVNEFGKDLFYQSRFGGTTLSPQQQPVYGMGADGLPVLPGNMDAHYKNYVEGLPPDERAEELKKYRRSPGDAFSGPGVIMGPRPQPGFEGKPYPGIIIGRSILFRRQPSGEFARKDDYPRGEVCLLSVLPLTRGGDVSPEQPPKPPFRYVDDSRTGIHEIDSQNVYVDFDKLQELLSMKEEKKSDGGVAAARCSQIQIKLAPEYADSRQKTLEAKKRLEEVWVEYRDECPADSLEFAMLRLVGISTWEEMQATYISAIEKEKFLVLIMFGVISIVAVFLILCIFYMIVQEKTRDIGIIKSIGGSAEGVAAVFLAYGGGIGLVGCILGALLGVTFVEHINDVQDWLARLNPNWRVWSPETYSFDKIPDVWKWSEVVSISILAVFASILGATFPALRAAKTWPVESLRYE